MKTNRTLLALTVMTAICGISSLANAQAFDPKDKTDLAPKAPTLINPDLEGKGLLVFASKIQETGEILDTQITKLTYLFRNTGVGPLTITQVKPSCGCTVPELSKKTYMPGEQGVLNVTFDPRGKHGPVARNITVFSDSETTPNQMIVVHALVSPVIISEPMVLAFEAVDKGHEVTKDIKVYGRTDDFKITRATIDDSSSFSIKVVDGGKVEKDGKELRLQILRVTLKADAKPDNHRAQITVRTNDDRKPIYSLATVARVLGDLQFNPIRVTMGRIGVGDEFERELHVTSKSGKPFEITHASANSVAIDATYEFEPVDPEKRTDWIVRIKGSVTNPAPRFNTQLHIVTNVKDEQQLTVQMYGQLNNK